MDGVDMRSEVALLSRNILIYGEMESSCYGKMCQFYSHDTFGGHVKVCIIPAVSDLFSDSFYRFLPCVSALKV